MSFKEIVQKAINTKIKTGLKSSIIVQNLDIHCFKSYRSSNSTSTTLKMLTQEMAAKKSHFEGFESKKTKLANKKASVLL